jgi:hypothetical protein
MHLLDLPGSQIGKALWTLDGRDLRDGKEVSVKERNYERRCLSGCYDELILCESIGKAVGLG